MEIKLEFRKYFMALSKKWWIIVIVGFACMLIGFGTNYNVKPDVYSGCATVYSAKLGSYTESLQGIQALEDYSDIINSYKVSNRAALILGDDNLDADKIKSMITYSLPEKSSIYYIYANSENEEEAVKVANAVASAFAREIRNITGDDTAQILDEASTSLRTYSGRGHQIKMILLFTFGGAFISALLIIAVAFFTTRLVTVKDCTCNGELKVLGVIPDFDIH